MIKDIRTIMSLLCNKRPNIDYERASTLRGGVGSSYSCVLANLPQCEPEKYIYLSSGEMSQWDREDLTCMDSRATHENDGKLVVLTNQSKLFTLWNDSKHNVPSPIGGRLGWGTTQKGVTHA